MGSHRPGVVAEEVISKIKDDGDFDKLRLMIIRKLKDNEDLKNDIVSIVKQSAALNRPGAEHMKPRELCDAIHEEVREKVMAQISDGLWKIIRSEDGMKTEITQTVQSVYDKLLNPHRSPTPMNPTHNGIHLAGKIDGNAISNGEMRVPIGLSSRNHTHNDSRIHHGEEMKREFGQVSTMTLENEDGEDSNPPPGFSSPPKLSDAGSDEDPDVPPGFG